MKKITLLLALFAMLIVPQFATAQTTNEAAIDQLLSTFKADGPGAAVLVAQKGKIIYQKAVGMADMELGVPLHMYSVSVLFPNNLRQWPFCS
jgi:CubicO group peptidase (beta-lactamase class C family)